MKGCAIYDARPHDCRLWSCVWLAGAPVSRPDRSGYVIDPMPDFVTVAETGERIPVLQVWVDPRQRHAWQDPDLLAYVDSLGTAAIIRFGARDAFPVFPPSMTGAGWETARSSVAETTHSAAEILSAIAATAASPNPEGQHDGQ
jgi:hypothetical protein